MKVRKVDKMKVKDIKNEITVFFREGDVLYPEGVDVRLSGDRMWVGGIGYKYVSYCKRFFRKTGQRKKIWTWLLRYDDTIILISDKEISIDYDYLMEIGFYDNWNVVDYDVERYFIQVLIKKEDKWKQIVYDFDYHKYWGVYNCMEGGVFITPRWQCVDKIDNSILVKRSISKKVRDEVLSKGLKEVVKSGFKGLDISPREKVQLRVLAGQYESWVGEIVCE